MTRRKELADGAGLNRLRQATENGAWLTDITHHLNRCEISREEIQNNLLLQYGIFTLNLLTECDGCGKKFSVSHSLS